MAKQINKRVRVASSDVAVGTSVHAPSQLNVHSQAAENAAALSGALKLGGDVVKLKQGLDVDAGTLAAEKGEVNEANLRQQEQNANWIMGAERVIGRSKAIKDEAAMMLAYQEEFDKGGDMPTLAVWIDDYQKGLYEGADEGIAREAAPFLARGAERLMAAHGEMQKSEALAVQREAFGDNTTEFLSRPEQDTDGWNELRTSYTDQLGKTEGLQALGQDMAAYMEGARDERVLDSPMFERMRTNPLTRDVLEAAASRAKSDRLNDWDAANAIQKGEAYAEAEAAAKSGDIASLTQLLGAGSIANEDGITMYSVPETKQLIRTYYSSRAATITNNRAVRGFLDGDGTLANEDLDDTFDAAEQLLNAEVEAGTRDPATVMPILLDRMAKQGKLTTRYKEMFANVNANSDPERMEQAYEVYSELRDVNPSSPAQLIPAADLQKMEGYELMLRDFGTPEKALDAMKQHNPSLIDTYTGTQIRDARRSVYGEALDRPWSFDDLEENPALNAMLNSRLRHFTGFPGVSLDRAMEATLNDITTRHRYVDGQLYSATAPWGQDADLVSEYARDSRGGEVDILPVPGSTTQVYIRPEGALFMELGDKHNIDDLRREYENEQHRIAEESAIIKNAKTAESVKQRAIKRAFPQLPQFPYARGNIASVIKEARDSQWDSMSESERKALYDEIIREDEIEKAERKAAGERSRASYAGVNIKGLNAL